MNYSITNDTCVIHNGITKIGEREVEQILVNYKVLVLPSTLKSIGESAFEYKILLNRVALPCGLLRIGDRAFFGCDELEEIIIPDTVTYLGKSAFDMCKKLSRVTIGNGVTEIAESVFACCGMDSIVIPGSVTIIKESAFYGCHKLKKLEIPPAVTIEVGAFYKTPIEDIYLSGGPSLYGDLIKAFEDGVFGDVDLGECFANIAGDRSWSVYGGITLHVPAGALAAYKSDPFFRKFDKIVIR